MSQIWGLLVVSIGMTLIPGIDTAMVLRVTLRGGRADGLKTAAGCATGLSSSSRNATDRRITMRWIALLIVTSAMCCGLACDKTIHEAKAPAPLFAPSH